MSRRDWQASTLEDGVSDAFVYFKRLTVDGWEAWLDARDRGEEEPRWADLRDSWESMSIYDVRVMGTLVGFAEDLRSVRLAWRLSSPVRGQRWERHLARIQAKAIAMAGEDRSDPVRDPGFLTGAPPRRFW